MVQVKLIVKETKCDKYWTRGAESGIAVGLQASEKKVGDCAEGTLLETAQSGLLVVKINKTSFAKEPVPKTWVLHKSL